MSSKGWLTCLLKNATLTRKMAPCQEGRWVFRNLPSCKSCVTRWHFSWHNVWHVAMILNLYKRNGAPRTPLFLLCGSIFTAGAPWASSILSFLHLPYTNKSKTNPNPLGCPVARLVSTLCIQYLHMHVCRFTYIFTEEENWGWSDSKVDGYPVVIITPKLKSNN